MKRLLSAILVLAMILALVPAVMAAGVQTVIDLNAVTAYKNPDDTTATLTQSGGTIAFTDMHVRRYGSTGDNGPLLAIPFTVSESGDYVLEFKTTEEGIKNKATAAAPAVYIAEYEIKADRRFSTITDGRNVSLIGYFDFSELAAADVYSVLLKEGTDEKTPVSVSLTANTKYTLVFICDGHSLELNNVTTNGEVADNFTVGSKGNIYVDGNILTTDYKQNIYLSGIRLTPVVEEPAEDEAADGTVSFAVTTNIDGFDGIDVASVSRGGSVTLTAHKQNITGYKFVGWKRGADTSNENAWVDITGDTYTVWSNTYLTAVYEKEDDKNVAFWNQNGAYIGSMTESVYKEQTALFTPKLTGFGTFLGWFTDGNKPFAAGQTLADGTTNAVAQYTASAITGVKHNGTAVADAGTYNAPVELNKDSETTAWLRDGEPIAYGKTYEFNVWDATNITEGTEEITYKVPVAILDYSDTHKAYMLEYDAGDYEIVEAGIIFGKDTADIKTYTSQRKEKHNQFTVPEEGTLEATGYIIYTLDNGASYKTKYVSVKTAE